MNKFIHISPLIVISTTLWTLFSHHIGKEFIILSFTKSVEQQVLNGNPESYACIFLIVKDEIC